jgi:MFS family permease
MLQGSSRIVRVAAIVQGAALVMFGASSRVLVSGRHFGLSNFEFAELLVPVILTAAVAALAASQIAGRVPVGRVVSSAFACTTAAMILVLCTPLVGYTMAATHALLFVASALIGVGFGLSMPLLTRYVLDINAYRAERSVIELNLLVAAGMAATVVAALAFVEAGFWWVVPMLITAPAVWVTARIGQVRLGRPAPPEGWRPVPAQPAPRRLGIYAVLAVVAALCFEFCVVWSQVHVARLGSAHLPYEALVLVALWPVLVMLGRTYFARCDLARGRQRSASIAPFVIGLAVVVVGLALAQRQTAIAGIFVLAGLGCAACLPLLARPGHERLMALSLVLTVGLVLAYPICLAAAHGSLTGLQHAGVTRIMIFGGACVLALLATAGASISGPWWPAGVPATGSPRGSTPAEAFRPQTVVVDRAIGFTATTYPISSANSTASGAQQESTVRNHPAVPPSGESAGRADPEAESLGHPNA